MCPHMLKGILMCLVARQVFCNNSEKDYPAGSRDTAKLLGTALSSFELGILPIARPKFDAGKA